MIVLWAYSPRTQRNFRKTVHHLISICIQLLDSTHRSWSDTDQWSIADTIFWSTDQHLADQLNAQYEKHFIWHGLLKHRPNRIVSDEIRHDPLRHRSNGSIDRDSTRPSETPTELFVTNQSNYFALRLTNIKSATWHGPLKHRSSREFLIFCLAALSANTTSRLSVPVCVTKTPCSKRKHTCLSASKNFKKA